MKTQVNRSDRQIAITIALVAGAIGTIFAVRLVNERIGWGHGDGLLFALVLGMIVFVTVVALVRLLILRWLYSGSARQ